MFLRKGNNMIYINPAGKKSAFYGNMIDFVEQVGFDWFT